MLLLLQLSPLSKILAQDSSRRTHVVTKFLPTTTAFHTATNIHQESTATTTATRRYKYHSNTHSSFTSSRMSSSAFFNSSSLSSTSLSFSNTMDPNQENDVTPNPVNLLPPPEKIIIVGSSNQDLTSYTNTIPKLGETVLGERFEVSAGGKGANQGSYSFRKWVIYVSIYIYIYIHL